MKASKTVAILDADDCAYAISGHGPVDLAAALTANGVFRGTGDVDRYGTGPRLNAFEDRIAAQLGTAAAVFMPSGTMAQQIALRIVADETHCRTFAAHPTTHLVLHEHDGYARLHDLTFVPAGSSVTPLTHADLAAIAEPVGTLLLELPQREIGGILPSWDDLVAQTSYARERGWHVHMDGARLWECGPFYDRPYAEIAALFDSIYVSFYKGIGAPAGAMLCGSASFISQARVWQRRHGGNLVTLAPYACAADVAFDERIGRMADYRDAATWLAHIVAEAATTVSVQPNPPHINMFHAYVRGEPDAMVERAQTVARDLGVWTMRAPVPSATDGVVKWEIAAGDSVIALGRERARTAIEALLSARP